MNKLRFTSLTALAAAAALAIAGCGSSSSGSTSSSSSQANLTGVTESATTGSASSTASGSSSATGGGAGGSIIVGSAAFAESEVLMNVYAEALKAKGVDVETKPQIGARPVYLEALKDGSIDLIPEYSGSLLLALDASATAVSSEDVYAALPAAVGSDLKVLEQSAAEDKDSINVTQATATEFNLKTIGDLKDHAGDWILGAAPEYETRADGVPGLETKYGVVFGTFKGADISAVIDDLKNNQIDAADLYTTDPAIKANNFVTLEDPENLSAAQNVLPLIKADKSTPAIEEALNAVSAKLTTDVLIDLNTQVAAGTDSATVAKDWLTSQGLI
jgi:osmoprotectant transport system substrate-binding protein